jgi:hypothetical protein
MRLFSAAEKARPHVRARSRSLPHDFVDGQWEGIIAASDGKTYFSVSSHSPDRNAQFYAYDPAADRVEHLIDVGAWCGDEKLVGTVNTQGKIHSQIYEVDGVLYCASTSAHRPAEAETPYRGGHFLSYNLETGRFRDLGLYPDRRGGLLTMHYEPVHRRLYAISQGDQTLVYYDLESEAIVTVGSVEDNPHQCRQLISDRNGIVYGSTWGHLIYAYDPRIDRMYALLTRLPRDPEVPRPARDPSTLWWRTTHWGPILWDEKSGWYYGVKANDEYLFRLRLPEAGGHRATVEGLASLAFNPDEKRNRHASLGLTRLGRRLYYCSYPIWRPMAHLMSYDLQTGEVADHGPIVTTGDRRVSEIHSLVAGGDGRLHAVAMVWSIEGEDPAKPWANRAQCYFHARLLLIDLEADLRPGDAASAPAP